MSTKGYPSIIALRPRPCRGGSTSPFTPSSMSEVSSIKTRAFRMGCPRPEACGGGELPAVGRAVDRPACRCRCRHHAGHFVENPPTPLAVSPSTSPAKDGQELLQQGLH